MPSKDFQPGDSDKAAQIATWGLAVGAAKWSLLSAAATCAGMAFSPVFRGLTIQFKTFLFIIPMAFGGCYEADVRLKTYEHWVRVEQRRQKYRERLIAAGIDPDAARD